MDDRFFHGILGGGVRVCGLHLNNLTPWHILNLHAIGSPMVTDGGTVTPPDILLFCKTLQASYPNTPCYKPTLRDVAWRVRLIKKATFEKQAKTLQDWLAVQMCCPKLYEVTYAKEERRGSLSSPSIFALVVALASKLSETVAAIWNMRLAEARWMDTTLAELNGSELTISYDEEEEVITQLTGAEAEAKAKEELPPELYKRWLKARRKNKIK